MLETILNEETVQLLPQRGLFWKKEKTLVVADLHWGKTAHFRKNGIPIPLQSQQNDEIRLAKLIQDKQAERLIIAGDLFHSDVNLQVSLFAHFRKHFQSLQIDLVIGNHDILKAEQYEDFNLHVHNDFLNIAPFCFAHDIIDSEHFVIHGHVHPALTIKSKGNRQPALKLCCFAEDDHRMILPAFGKFTGTHTVSAGDFKRIFLVAEQNIIQWK